MNDTKKQTNHHGYYPKPAGSAGIAHKEHEPIRTTQTEAVQTADVEPRVDKELAEAGVEQAPSHERVPLASDLKSLGVAHAGPTLPASLHPTGLVSLPLINREEVLREARGGLIENAKRWLSLYVLRQEDKIREQRLDNDK